MNETNFSEEQKAIITAPLDEKTVVMATAASGKTRCSIERLVHVLESGVDPKKVVALTFTNNAAAEMKNRIPEKYRKDGHPFVGTIHSYANSLLQSHGFDTSRFRNDDEFDKLFDMVYENPQVIPTIDYLIVDETQDLNIEQLAFLETLEPKGCLYVGDVRQSIYSFKGASPRKLLSLMKRQDTEVRELTQNYRNAKKIIKYSETFVSKMKDVKLEKTMPMRDIPGVIKTIGSFDIIPTIKTDTNWGKWAVLCRTNQTVKNIMSLLERNDIPCISFRQAQGSLDDLNEKMSSNAVKVLTIHSSKGLEFDKVIVHDIYTKGDEPLRLTYVAVTRARDELYIRSNKKT